MEHTKQTTVKEDEVLKTKVHYEVRESSDPSGDPIWKGKTYKFSEYKKAAGFVTELCPVDGSGYWESDLIIVEVKTTETVHTVWS